MASSSESTYLGLDLSTQQLKAAVLDDKFQILHETAVHFDNDLPEFRTHGGIIQDKEYPGLVTAPTLMWVKAVDMLMDRLTVCGVDYSKIVAISGAAQQHGSVYWNNGAEKILRNLNSSQFLHQQLATSFSVSQSPTWMDSSTTAECKALEDAVGGPLKLAEITGSRGYERFTGPQIAKIVKTKPDAYKATERISLISSFLCSLFLGKIAPIDIMEASGTNLMDIKSKTWNETLLDRCGPNLKSKLGDTVPSNTKLGKIAPYFVDRWDFNPECEIIAFTGDNASSLIGLRLNPGWLAVSLGTSDTVFLWLQEPHVVIDGHIFCNPIDKDAYLGLLCFKNGSLSRERIRNNCTEGSWEIFNMLLDSTPRGNFGNIGLYYDTQEIIPFLSGDYRFNKAGDRIVKFTSLEVEVRALIEGQFMAKRMYAEDFGFKFGEDTKLLATGGASCNKSILQVMADVFNAPVYTLNVSNSATIGSAYHAKIGLLGNEKTYQEITACLPEPELVCTPYSDAADIYEPMLKRYRNIIQMLVKTS
ncbi:hypothetical protein PPYR_14841 [Photinus pyralis]|uniref:Xylulose kinase n=1 Tax=Photinus pyralis TaxID=7054 RepID=A0A1Y1LDQ7_PHOPY|nr:xylulose kinase-like [Photinus pyralis]KAB0790713.1 hypothetical protein PPYR_14841 [Photinus pyralis]